MLLAAIIDELNGEERQEVGNATDFHSKNVDLKALLKE